MNWLSQFVVRLNIYCITPCPKAACTLGEEMQTLLMEMATPLPEHSLDQVLHRSALAQLLEQHTDLFFLWRSLSAEYRHLSNSDASLSREAPAPNCLDVFKQKVSLGRSAKHRDKMGEGGGGSTKAVKPEDLERSTHHTTIDTYCDLLHTEAA